MFTASKGCDKIYLAIVWLALVPDEFKMYAVSEPDLKPLKSQIQNVHNEHDWFLIMWIASSFMLNLKIK